MNLKTYIDNLLKLVETNPEALTMDVVTSSDDEGNSYNRVHYEPSLGCFTDEEGDGEFSTEDSCEPDQVCVN